MTAPAARVFRYKPAPLSGQQEVRIGDGLLWIAGEGPFELARLDAAFLENSAFGDSRMLRLDLFWGEEHRAVGFNGGRRGYADNADAREHRAAVAAILRALAMARPGARVTLGPPKGPSLVMFGVGAASFIAGVAIGAGALANGRIAGAAIPVVLLVLIGAALLIAHWPLARRRAVDAATLADEIAPPGPPSDAA